MPPAVEESKETSTVTEVEIQNSEEPSKVTPIHEAGFKGFKPSAPDVASISSLHDILEDEESSEDVAEEKESDNLIDSTDVSAERLSELFDGIREELVNQFKGSLAGVLKLTELEFDKNRITVKGARSNLMQLEQVRGDFVQIIRNHSGSRSVELEFIEVDVKTGSSRPYTDSEKFEAMASKQPFLKEFRDKLGLEFD